MSEKTSTVHNATTYSSPVQVGSEKSFGFIVAVVFCIIGVMPLYYGGSLRSWALGTAVVFMLVAVITPELLRPLNLLWHKFGLLLHRVMTPVIIGLMFFVVIAPLGFLMRATGKDPLRLKRSSTAQSYWIERTPPGPDPSTMKQQF